MMSAPSSAIGGYFELELPLGEGEYHQNALRYQSARAALLDLLRKGRPTALWMPWYICDSMVEAPAMAGVPIHRYGLDERLHILDAQPQTGDWLLYVNYFGLCEQNVTEVLSRFDPEHVVIDNSQAFFSPPCNNLATIYSPRKFFGVPDGGYMFTQLNMPEPVETDTDSLMRTRHLLGRLGDGPEKTYRDFLAAEASLSRQQPKRMSQLTRSLLSRIPYQKIINRRKENFSALHRQLSASNHFPVLFDNVSIPLCYPYFSRTHRPPEYFQGRRIYIPRYWPEISRTQFVPELENSLVEHTYFLPCDQRMTAENINRLLHAVMTSEPAEPAP